MSLGDDGTATKENDRAFCLSYHFCCLIKLFFSKAFFFLSLIRLLNILFFVFAFIGCYILGYIHKHRAGSSACSYLKCSSYSLCKLLYILYNEVMLCNRHGHACYIHLLKRVLSKKIGAYISCNCYHRNRIHICIGNTGYKVGCTRTACRKADSDLTCCPCISVSRMCSSLLVRSKDMLYFILMAVKLIIEI